MPNISQLVAQTINKRIEVTGGPLYQCTDLVNYWLRMQGLPLITGRNAIDFRTAPGYTFVKNTPDFLPKEGDIAIFDIGMYGDVAVVAPGTTINDLVVYGQNYPIGAGCRYRMHKGYGGMLNNRGGFLVLGETGPKTVKAQPGDSLSKIGKRHGVPLDRMKQLNPQVRPPFYVIKVGQTINIG